MFSALSPGAIGIRGLSLTEEIEMARAAGFAGLAFDGRALAALVAERGADGARAAFDAAGVRPGYWGLPVAWSDEERWRDDLERLPAVAAACAAVGGERTVTWVPPGSNERPFEEQFAWFVERLRPIAAALVAEGCRLGLEFIGPETFRAQFRHGFVHTLGGTLELAAAIGTGNVGVLLDAWHLHASGGEPDAIRHLAAGDMVVVHVNDAPVGTARAELIDTVRELPGATGVIDLAGFAAGLRAIGYDGPVTPEPFNRRLNDLAAEDPLAAARRAAEATTGFLGGTT